MSLITESPNPASSNNPRHTVLTDHDIYLFKQGTHFRLYEKLGAHLGERDGVSGTWFSVWAPNAKQVSVIGQFNNWSKEADLLSPIEGGAGIWQRFVAGAGHGDEYKFHITSHHNNYFVDKGDPYAYYWQEPPSTASRIWHLAYQWGDDQWMRDRSRCNAPDAPWAIYEVHLGSWMRMPEHANRFLTYREIAPRLASHVKQMGFTHV